MKQIPSVIRQNLQQVRTILDNLDQMNDSDLRVAERIALNAAAEITTSRGNTMAATIRDINSRGIGLRHQSPLFPGIATVKIVTEECQYIYRISIDWCAPSAFNEFVSGGHFLGKCVLDEALEEDS